MNANGQILYRNRFIMVLLLLCICTVVFVSACEAVETCDVVLTSSDRQFITRQPQIRVAINEDFLPLEGYDSNTHACVGFVVNMLRHISDRSGLDFKFVRTGTIQEAGQLLKQGKVDMLAGYDGQLQHITKFPHSDVYMKASLLIVGSKKFRYDGGRIVIAIPERLEHMEGTLTGIYPNASFSVCHSTHELFRAVQSGKADALVTNVYSMQSKLEDTYSDLAIIYDTEKLAEYRFAFAAGTDQRLIALINRYIKALPENEKNKMLVTSTLSNLNTIDAAQTVRTLSVVVAVISVLLVILAVFVLILRKKNQKIQHMLALEKEYEEVVASRAMLEGMFDTVYEIDITHDQAVSPAGYSIKKRLGLAADCSYTEMEKAITEKTVKEEFRALHLETFDRENILKRFSEGSKVCTIDVIRKQDFVNYVWNRITICSYQSVAANAVKAVVYVKNIQAEKEAEQRLIDEASTDAMTGLYNRRSAMMLIEHIIEQSSPSADFHALMIMDVDNFKKINDTLGHAAGDDILKSIAGIIKSCFRERDVVSRIGGDEFLVFMKDCRSAETAIVRAQRILSLLHAAYADTQIGVMPTLSIGVAFYPTHTNNYEDLFTLADAALYEVKENGRNGLHVFCRAENARLEIHDTNKKLHEAIVASSDGVAKYALNRGFRIFYCTDRILSIMQLTPADMQLGADTAPYVHPDDRQRVYEELRNAYEHHRHDPFSCTYRIRKADGTYFRVRVNGFFVDDVYTDPADGEQYPMFYLIFTNMSEL